jgi:hypothetical protein
MPEILSLTMRSVAGAGIARTYWMVQLHTSATRDLTWIGHEMLVWGLIEMHFAIICASAPVLKAFFSIFFSDPYSKYSKSTDIQATSLHTNQSMSAEKSSINHLESGDWSDADSSRTERKKAKIKADWATITVTETFSVRRSLSASQKRMLGID